MKTKKFEFNYFALPDFEREEQYLRERHRQGWRVTHVLPIGLYRFEACEPEDYIYRLDFPQGGAGGREAYRQIFTDCGWEYLLDMNGWNYFRKRAASAQDEEEIFSDNASKLELIERIFRQRMIPILLLSSCCVLPYFWMCALGALRGGLSSPVHIVFSLVLGAAFVLYVRLIAHCALGLARLRREHAAH